MGVRAPASGLLIIGRRIFAIIESVAPAFLRGQAGEAEISDAVNDEREEQTIRNAQTALEVGCARFRGREATCHKEARNKQAKRIRKPLSRERLLPLGGAYNATRAEIAWRLAGRRRFRLQFRGRAILEHRRFLCPANPCN
jgi:hypothetical protein